MDEETQPDGLIARLQRNGARLAQGRRLILPLPGWDDLGDGRGLWARFVPLTRTDQMRVQDTDAGSREEIDALAGVIAKACEEIEIGTKDHRSMLAKEPDVAEMIDPALPLVFNDDLGRVLGVGGDTPEQVVKRVLIRANDDQPFFAIGGHLLAWSGQVMLDRVEAAAGE